MNHKNKIVMTNLKLLCPYFNDIVYKVLVPGTVGIYI